MSLSAKSANRTKSAIRDRSINREAMQEIRSYLEGCFADCPYWDLSQEEADKIQTQRVAGLLFGFEDFILSLKQQGKSAGARYIAARIFSGAAPDLKQLTLDWFAHRSIKRELSEEELREIGATPMDLRIFGIQHRWEARRFYNLYREVLKKDRVWNSSCQVNKDKVKAIALTPNYNRLPLWAKKAIVRSNHWIDSGEDARIGNVWRLVDCAKVWKYAPDMPKGIAEKIGKMPVKYRILATWAWESIGNLNFRELHQRNWRQYGECISRADTVKNFWVELKRLQSLSLPALIAKRKDDSGFTRQDHNLLRFLSEEMLGLPRNYLFESWGRARYASGQKYLNEIATHGSPEQVCQNLFGSAGKATVKAFQASDRTAWQWASALCDCNPDAAQKILSMPETIAFEVEAIDFLKSLPMVSRLRLLQATTFKYRGEVCPISSDHVRDTGYLWKNFETKPELGRVRCWFTVHEHLSAAFVKELPDEALPVPAGWERVDGLSGINGSWSIELPKRVATLKYWGQILKNCVGGYGPAIKSERSIIFTVRESGLLTHCVEICDGDVNQFYRAGNSSPNWKVERSVCDALRQANLIQ